MRIFPRASCTNLTWGNRRPNQTATTYDTQKCHTCTLSRMVEYVTINLPNDLYYSALHSNLNFKLIYYKCSMRCWQAVYALIEVRSYPVYAASRRCHGSHTAGEYRVSCKINQGSRTYLSLTTHQVSEGYHQRPGPCHLEIRLQMK